MIGGTVPVGCGQCLPCRVNRRRVWTARQVLESYMHPANAFVTLTYDNDHLPEKGSLVARDTQLWLKRFRKELDRQFDVKVRFFLCGEYGDQTWRPHYHASLFGVGMEVSDLVRSTWAKGHVMVTEFNETTAAYTAGYVVKKLTDKSDLRLEGRAPEFCRMSNRPGIGAKAMEVIRDAVLTDAGLDEYLKTGDVPMKLQMGRRSMPLGRYLREKLRQEVGVSEADNQKRKQRFFDEKGAEMLSLLCRSIIAEEALSARALVVRENLGKIRNVEARANIFKKRGLL